MLEWAGPCQGGGFDYFLANNVAVNMEAKRSFFFDTTAHLNSVPVTLHPDLVEWTTGLRLFFR